DLVRSDARAGGKCHGGRNDHKRGVRARAGTNPAGSADMKRSQRFTNAGLGILTVLAVLGSRPAIAEDGAIFVPVVLAVDGIGGSHFTSEMTLSNHGTTSAMLTLRYTATA